MPDFADPLFIHRGFWVSFSELGRLEILHRALMSLRRFASSKRTKVAALPGFGILLA